MGSLNHRDKNPLVGFFNKKQKFERSEQVTCGNCGSSDHAIRDCLERPHKVRAKFRGINYSDLGVQENVLDLNPTSRDTASDPIPRKQTEVREYRQHRTTSALYQEKRDFWGRYDPSDYVESVILPFNEKEEIQKKILQKRLREEKIMANEDSAQMPNDVCNDITSSSYHEDAEVHNSADYKIVSGQNKGRNDTESKFDGDDSPGTANVLATQRENESFGSDILEEEDAEITSLMQQSIKRKGDDRGNITNRNLRVREDVAKYLHNLSDNSAQYDPKSRAMRGDPFESYDTSLGEDSLYTNKDFAEEQQDKIGDKKNYCPWEN